MITSLHHVTATVAHAQEDVDFYTKLLGLRLVKRTVNFDNRGVYHFYYGDARGTPGSIMTTFPYAGMGVRTGVKGAGQITATAFRVPSESLDFWRDRLVRHDVSVEERERRFGEEVIAFTDPSGLILEIVSGGDDRTASWVTDGIDADAAILTIHGVTLEIRDPVPTFELLQDGLGLKVTGREDNRTRVQAGSTEPAHVLDVLHVPDGPAGVNGIGTVHHVALAIKTEDEQLAVQEELRRKGFNVTDVRDRQYFRSIYFREPGGVLLEVATEGPGFLIDEPEDALGRSLKLPPWEEPRRSEIAAALPPIEV